jgi:membrane associated rhomboid family serine protease
MPAMGNIFTNLRRIFRQGSILRKLIYINIAVFAIVRLWEICFRLFNETHSLLPYIQMPSSPEELLRKPWTLISYMFTHYDFLHILFNMLWLYWFGAIFLQFFRPRQLGGLYILGGIAGGLLFMLAYNVFPYFQADAALSTPLIGASASVMAIVFAVSFYQKDYQISLLFLGRIKLIYLALVVLLIDLLSITSDNAGGHIAHLGGAFLGLCFAWQIKSGKDLTSPMNRLIDALVNMRKRRSKLYVSYNKRNESYNYNAGKQAETAAIDAILDKLKRSGYAGLSAAEKKKLFDAGKK